MWRKSRLLLNEVIEVIGFVLHDPFIPPLANVTDLNPFIQVQIERIGNNTLHFPNFNVQKTSLQDCESTTGKMPYILWEKRHKRP